MNNVKREPTGDKYNSYKMRLSQLITTYGPGGIVDFPDQPLMVADVRYWGNDDTINIHDERLEKILGVDEFRMYKENSDIYDSKSQGVPFIRFPRWYYCPKCKTFKPIEEWQKDYEKDNPDQGFMLKPRCSNIKCKNVLLVAPSILVACEKGHIDDFPWIEWTHMYEKQICKSPQLEIESVSSSLGLESFVVKCKCGAKNSLDKAFNKNAFENSMKKELLKCKGKLQWKNGENSRENCGLYPQAILRNASNVYFPKIETSIVIPPYSEEMNTLIENSKNYDCLMDRKRRQEKKGKLEEFIKDELEEYIEDIAKEINRAKDLKLVGSIIRRKLSDKQDDKNSTNSNIYRFEEYNALIGKIKSEHFDTRDFKIEKVSGNKYNIKEIASVTLVKRLREVRALTGFTRINPPNNYIMGIDTSDLNDKTVSVKPENGNWYPAYEVRGEGIFIEIDKSFIDEWLKDNIEVLNRVNKLNYRYNEGKNEKQKRIISPKFVMLHTLAHLLIKELSFECGYSVTSLRERLYCDVPGEEDIMNGILIYTADSDSEGSLGGLVKQGRTDRLPKIFLNAIKRAKWCSYDPVCINSTGQGRNGQNLAACYNCTLLPETSCEEFNVLLDRALIVGSLDNEKLGFLSSYI